MVSSSNFQSYDYKYVVDRSNEKQTFDLNKRGWVDSNLTQAISYEFTGVIHDLDYSF